MHTVRGLHRIGHGRHVARCDRVIPVWYCVAGWPICDPDMDKTASLPSVWLVRPVGAESLWHVFLTRGGKFVTMQRVIRNTRPVRWMKAALRDFEDFPQGARDDLLDALTAVAEGGHPTIAKPLTGLGSGVMELALRHRGDAFRVV